MRKKYNIWENWLKKDNSLKLLLICICFIKKIKLVIMYFSKVSWFLNKIDIFKML